MSERETISKENVVCSECGEMAIYEVSKVTWCEKHGGEYIQESDIEEMTYCNNCGNVY